MKWIALFTLPLFVGGILLTALRKRVNAFDEFCAGAKDGLAAALRVLPSLVALMTAVMMLRASGFTEWLVNGMRPLASWLGFPSEVLPLAVLRPLSGNGSLAILRDVLQMHGADSMVGQIASVMQSSTETTFYTLTVYFGYVGIRKTGCVLPAALIGDLTGMILSVLTVRIFS